MYILNSTTEKQHNNEENILEFFFLYILNGKACFIIILHYRYVRCCSIAEPGTDIVL